MATTYNHAQIGIVDASGNVNVIYPITTGADVSITRTNTKLPTAAVTAQALANALGKLAFADSEISDSETSTTKTWSSNKINTAITELNSNLKKSFQAGVDTLYNKCKDCGSTPTAKTPTAISTSIQTIYTNRYNSGYNTGRTQGQNDVKGNPNGYGFYTSAQYSANYNAGYNAGAAAVNSTKASSVYATMYNFERGGWINALVQVNGPSGKIAEFIIGRNYTDAKTVTF